MRRLGTLLLFIVTAWLQHQLWFGQSNWLVLRDLQHQVSNQQQENQRLASRNQLLVAEIVELKQGFDAIEERARHELGMVREGETFVWIVEKQSR